MLERIAILVPIARYPSYLVMFASTAEQEMLSETVNYGGNSPFLLRIDNNAKDTLFTWEHYQEENAEIRDYWLLQGHTHKLGIDYDMFYRMLVVE